MRKKKLLTRLVSGAVVVAVTAGSALLTNGVASAVPPPGTEGFITISPPEGSDIELMSSMTSGPCPDEAFFADLIIVGPIGAPPATATFPPDNPYPVTTVDPNQFSTTDPFVQQFNKTLRDAAVERGRTIQIGEYHLTTRCFDEIADQVLGTFTGGLIFDTPTHYTVIPNATPTPTPTPTPTVTPTVTPTPTPTPTPTVTPTPTPGAKATTIKLSVIQIDLPFGGGFAIPIANVAPFNATGTVQFKDGATPIASAQVFGGVAVGPFKALPSGSHSITAVFTPSNPTAFKPSTSNTVKFRF